MADLAIKFRSHSGALEVKFVLEVGFLATTPEMLQQPQNQYGPASFKGFK